MTSSGRIQQIVMPDPSWSSISTGPDGMPCQKISFFDSFLFNGGCEWPILVSPFDFCTQTFGLQFLNGLPSILLQYLFSMARKKFKFLHFIIKHEEISHQFVVRHQNPTGEFHSNFSSFEGIKFFIQIRDCLYKDQKDNKQINIKDVGDNILTYTFF